MVVRGCGTRKVGGIYLTVPLGPNGTVIEKCLVDPPSVVDPDRMGLTAVGVMTMERGGVTHIMDWVGANNYPNVADFIEEARRHGISRRVSRGFDFSSLSPSSRLLLVHPRAHIDNYQAYYDALDTDREQRPGSTRWSCPKHIPAHTHWWTMDAADRECCAGIWMHDVEDGEVLFDPVFPYRTVKRTIGSTSYHARRRPDDVVPVYRPAIFMTVPIPRIDVIRDPKDGSHVDAYEAAKHAGIDVLLVDE